MKKISIVLLIVYCNLNVTSAQSSKNIDLRKSEITWEGSKLFGFGSHTGTVNFKNGVIITKGHKITGGEFLIDMHSIKSNEKETWVKDLVNHLKNEDFFDVKNNPLTKLIMTKVKYIREGSLRINANLTINKVTKPITFNARLNDAKTQMDIRFKIDRTRWNIIYKSQGKTSVKDQVISDAIAFKIKMYL